MRYYLSLGSNQGEKIKFMKAAKYLLASDLGVLLKESCYYETEAVYMPAGTEDFINQVIIIQSDLVPQEFLEKTKEIEIKIGRKNKGDHSDRVIDIDILFIDNLLIKKDDFVIPHKEMHLRNFVLVPFVEIAKDFIHPVLEKTISKLLEDCRDKNTVKKI